MYRSGGIYDPTLLIPLFACSAPVQGTIPPGRFDGETANTVQRDYKTDASVMNQIEPGVTHALSLLNDWTQDRFLAACDGKQYNLYEANGAPARAVRQGMLMGVPDSFPSTWSTHATHHPMVMMRRLSLERPRLYPPQFSGDS